MGNIGEGVIGVIIFLSVVCLISVPFAIWKFVEIIIWFVHHISISLQ